MKIEKFKIAKPKTYIKGGQERTFWQEVGVMTFFHKDTGEISRKIEIPAIGLDAQVFPFEDKKESRTGRRPEATSSMTPEEEWSNYGTKEEADEDVVNPEDIPY